MTAQWIDWRVGQPPKNAKPCQTAECGHPKGSHGGTHHTGRCLDSRCVCSGYEAPADGGVPWFDAESEAEARLEAGGA